MVHGSATAVFFTIGINTHNQSAYAERGKPLVRNYVSMPLGLSGTHEESISRLLLYHPANKEQISGAQESNGREGWRGLATDVTTWCCW